MEKSTTMIIAAIFALIMVIYFLSKFILEAQMKSVPSIGIYMTFYTFMAFCTWLFCAPDETPVNTPQEASPLPAETPIEIGPLSKIEPSIDNTPLPPSIIGRHSAPEIL